MTFITKRVGFFGISKLKTYKDGKFIRETNWYTETIRCKYQSFSGGHQHLYQAALGLIGAYKQLFTVLWRVVVLKKKHGVAIRKKS